MNGKIIQTRHFSPSFPLNFLLILVAAITFCSCQREVDIPLQVKKAIAQSGANEAQLMSAIQHYANNPKDSLKLKALFYQIENMRGWSYYQGPVLEGYLQYLPGIRRNPDNGAKIMDSIYQHYGTFSTGRLQKCHDLETITSGQLIENMDMAFKVWQEQPWCKGLRFDQFCEYILPFRVEDEQPAFNRREIYQQFNGYLDSIRAAGGSSVDACKVLNDLLIGQKWLFTTRIGFLPHFDAPRLLTYRTGSCRDMADMGTFIMRAVGIPVGNDYLIQWPYRNQGHNWNIVLKNGTDSTIMFLTTEDNPRTPHKPHTKKGKVYRNTFYSNSESLAIIKDSMDQVPPAFENARMIDVTDQYVACHDIAVRLDSLPMEEKFVYLCVFNNRIWVPIHWSKLQKGNPQVTFTKTEGGIVAIAGVYKNNAIIPVSAPFVIKEDGTIQYLRSGKSGNVLTLSRIYPTTADDFYVGDLDNAEFQGSTDANFTHATTLYRVARHPLPYWNKITFSTPPTYRYYRCVLPPGNNCLGEMAYYQQGQLLHGKPLAPMDTAFHRRETGPEKAMDGNFETGFSSFKNKQGWVGIDFGRPVRPDSILFAAKIYLRPEIFIVPKHQYELYYWKDNTWKSLGIKIATGPAVTFRNLPQNALFVLNDVSCNVGKRIFTYSQNKLEWW